jgi:hypothetical protein
MIQTRIYLDQLGEYRLVRARTRDRLFNRITKLLGGNKCWWRLEGWNDDEQFYHLTVCRVVPLLYGPGYKIIDELSVSLPRSAA